FQNRIFPLLQEYFFDDWAKIKAVLGNNAFVTAHTVQNSRQLADFVDEGQELYERLPAEEAAWHDPAEYRRIYGGHEPDEPDSP
ncbi:MAG: hypothetical protein OXC14_14555, partial [Rhodospirillaceae bacterium]|nr:hypothetical protein [Rhodospirillaceae bacterium]